MIQTPQGRYCLSRIVPNRGGFSVAAQLKWMRNARHIAAFYPPFNDDHTGFAAPFALVRIDDPQVPLNPDQDNILLPDMRVLDSVSRLTLAEKNLLAEALDRQLVAYQFNDWDQSRKIRNPYDSRKFAADASLQAVLLDVFDHLAHSQQRPRPTRFEDHNTEYLDDFDTDPYSAPRWTNEAGTNVWDGTNFELDMAIATGGTAARYSANGTGSIEHEAQATYLGGAGGDNRYPGGGAVRFDEAGVNDWYFMETNQVDDVSYFSEVNGGTYATLQTNGAFALTDNVFITIRLAAEGAAGANVVLSNWETNHGTSKPSDPGWLGDSGSPDNTFTDTSANRLDASTHSQCGIACGGGGADYDTRHDFFKQRTIADRSGGGAAASFMLNHMMQHH